MKVLRQYKEAELLFIDIETVRATDKLDDAGPLKEAWLYKARYQNEVDKKTGEVISPEDYYRDKAALYSPFNRIVVIVAGYIEKGGKNQPDLLKTKIYSGEEKELLDEFNQDVGMLSSARPGLCFAGFNNIGFDQKMILNRMLVHDIVPHELLDTAHLKPWEVRALDLAKLWQATGFYPDSLAAVAAAMGLASPKSALSGSEVSDAFYQGRLQEIERYCVGDVLTTANIYRKWMRKGLVVLS